MNPTAHPGSGRLPEDARHRLVQAARSHPGADEESRYRRAAEVDQAIRYAKSQYPQFFNLT